MSVYFTTLFIVKILIGTMFLVTGVIMPLFSFGEGQSPLWDKNWNPNISQDAQRAFNTGFNIPKIEEKCGPASNEICINCHEISINAPDPQIRLISEPTHGTGMYRLNAAEYLSINMHTFSQNLVPKCTACHFNPKISKEELRSFQYKKIGDKLCYACHQDKAPAKFRASNEENLLQDMQRSKENGIMEELKNQFLSKRASVAAYRKRLKID